MIVFSVRTRRFALAPLFGSLLFLNACTDLSEFDQQRINKALADSLLNITETWQLNLEIIEDGQRVVTMQSPYAITRHDDESETLLNGPVLVWVKNEFGDTTTTLQSQSAIYNSRRSRFLFTGDVRVETSEQKRLYSEVLVWHQRERTISTEDFVSITTPTDSIAGYGLQGTDDLSEYVISRVTGEFEISSD